MKKILITGGFGILGTSLSHILYKKNYKIFLLDRGKKKRKMFKNYGSKIKIIKGNFNNINQLKKMIKKTEIDTIIHLGASTQVMDSFKTPYDTFQTNIMGTINILEAVRNVNKNINIIFSSTIKAYGKMINKSYKETNPLRGDLPDEVSKSAADLIAQSYVKTYNLKIGIFRSCNIYGPADFNMDRLIPGTIVQALKSIPVKLRTSGKLKRDYLYVDDASNAYYKLMLYMKKNKKKKLFIYNLGSRFNFNSLEVVNLIYKIMKIKLKPVIINNSSMEIVAQKIDFSKAEKELKWMPSTSFKEGILKTVKWYKEYYQEYI